MEIMILLALLPVLVGLLFAVCKLKLTDKRLLIAPIIVASCLSLISAIGFYFAGTSKVYFKEIWNYRGLEVRYYEDWNERVSCRHPEYCTRTTTDSKGNIQTETYQCGYMHRYDVDYHPERWAVLNEYGNEEPISKKTFEKWTIIFTEGTKSFKNLNRNYHTNDGDMYFSKWRGEFEKSMPLSKVSTYINRVRVSDSAFKYKAPTPGLLERFPRPADANQTNPIIAPSVAVSTTDQLLFRRINAKYGIEKQIHSIVVLFQNEPRSVVDDLLSSWQGPNKNELVTVVGLNNSNEIDWVEVFSWMDDTTIHASIKQKTIGMKTWNAVEFAQILDTDIPKLWNRKEFADFAYIQIPIDNGWFIASFVVSCIIVTATVVLVYNMDKAEQSQNSFMRGRYGFRKR